MVTICPYCGEKLTEKGPYCIYCGKKAVSSNETENSHPDESKSPIIIQPSINKEPEIQSKSTLKNTIGFFDKIGGAIKQGTRKVGYELLLRDHNIHIKKLIIQEFNFVELKKMCLYFKIGSPHPTRINSRNEIVHITPTYDHWAGHAFKRIGIEKLKDYAKGKNFIPYRITELEKRYHQERLSKYSEYEKADETSIYSNDNEFLTELITVINEYRPIKPFRSEDLYHTNLYTFLCEKIPGEIGFEQQRGSSRPDITVGDIAIEVKGPTDSQGLVTIADKINRYSQHFEFLIVVLFEVEVYERFYQEWYEGIMNQYQRQVAIIRK